MILTRIATTSESEKVGVKERKFGSLAMAGMRATAIALAASKLASFVLHISLGWLLLREDFRLYAMAVTLTTVSAALRDGGVGRIMIQQGTVDPLGLRSIAKFCQVFNVASGLLLLAILPLAVQFYTEPKLAPLVLCMAITVALSSSLTVGRARMLIALRFGDLARYDATVAILRCLATICFAAAGFGALSFLLPALMEAVLGGLFFRVTFGPLASGPTLTTDRFRAIFRWGRWAMVASMASSLAMMGDYLILGRFAPELLSDYFFGFQITVLLSATLVQMVNQVMMPIFTNMGDDSQRLGATFRKVGNVFLLFGSTLSVIMMLIAPAVIHHTWQGKWNGAIIVVQILSLNLCIRLMSPLYVTFLQAKGYWSSIAISYFLEAVIVVATTLVAVRLGFQMAGIVASIAVMRSITPVGYTIYCVTLMGLHPAKIFRDFAARIAVPVGIGLTCWLGASQLSPSMNSVWGGVMATAVFLLTVGMVAGIYFRAELEEAWGLVRGSQTLG